MELRIDQNVLDRFPNLNVTKENDVVTVKFNEGNGNSDLLKSEKELYGRTFYSNDGEGYWYALFMQENFPWFKLNGDNEKDWQWLRSVFAVRDRFLHCLH